MLTVPVVTHDLGGEVYAVEAASEALTSHGFTLQQPAEERLWRSAYRLGRPPIIEADLGSTEVALSGRTVASTRTLRIHPIGVVAVRYAFEPTVSDMDAAWRRNEAFAELRDAESTAREDGAVYLWQTLQTIRQTLAPYLRQRPAVFRRSSLNTLQVARVVPDDATLAAWAEAFNLVQGGSVGADGSVFRSEHLVLRRWRTMAFLHYRSAGQTLVLTEDDEVLADVVAAYERAHATRTWLRSWVEALAQVEIDDLSGRILDTADLRALACRQLDLANLRQRISTALVDADDRTIPSSSNIGRQATSDLSTAVDVDGWRAIVAERLAALQDRTEAIAAVVDREYQEVRRAQGSKLELLFAGSFAASLMALIPALLALAGWGRPALPWVLAVVAGTIGIWGGVLLWSALHWRVAVSLASSSDRPNESPKGPRPDS